MTTAHPQTEIVENLPRQGPADTMAVATSLDEHLAQAAKLASDYGVPPDAFAAAAWHAYLHASPALAEHIEKLQFMAGIEELRNSGRLAKA
jgi:predicted HD phosphohydrolase